MPFSRHWVGALLSLIFTQDTDCHLAAGGHGTPSQTPQQAPPAQHPPPPQMQQQQMPPGYPGAIPAASPPAMPGYNFPQPTHSGSLDLSAIKPVSSGSVSIQDALAKARGFAAQKGLAFDPRPGTDPWAGIGNPSQTYPMTAHQEDPRLGGRPYRRSRSRSRSPQRRDGAREGYNPYRDERRDERRGGGYARDRSRSPPRRETFSPTNQQYGGRTSPPNDNSEVILIDSSLVGLVIGRQGESLRRIEQESNTRIQFINGPEAGPQRQCRITGQPSARISAKREINRIIEENGGNPARETGRNSKPGAKPVGQQQPALREGEQSSQIMVPDRTVGLIIGRGGETIRDLQERSGCHVNIVGENKSVNGLRPVNLIGSPAAAAHAKELIMEIVDSDTKQMDGSAQPQQAAPQQQAGRRDNFDPYSGAGAGAAAGAGNKINDSMLVPSDAVGMIIGKGTKSLSSHNCSMLTYMKAVKPSSKCNQKPDARSMSLKLLAPISSVRSVLLDLVNLSMMPNVPSGRRSTKWYVILPEFFFCVN
jgi:far upstream element-binding protein